MFVGRRRSTPKRPRPMSNKGQGAGEPAQIALCVCAKSSSRCSDGRPECLLLVWHRRRRGKSKGKVSTGRSEQERAIRGDRRPSRMASSLGRSPGNVGGQRSGTSSRVALEPDQESARRKGDGVTRRRRPPVEKSGPPRTKSQQRQGRTWQIKRVSSRTFCSGTRLFGPGWPVSEVPERARHARSVRTRAQAKSRAPWICDRVFNFCLCPRGAQ